MSSPVAAADDDVWDDDYAYYQDDEFAFTGCVVYLDVARQKDLMFSSLAQVSLPSRRVRCRSPPPRPPPR